MSVPLKQQLKTNIRSASGTPVDSRRFRQAGKRRQPHKHQKERENVLTSIVVSIVRACTRFASLTVLIALILAVAAGYYTSRDLRNNTDIKTPISPHLHWRQRDNQFEKAVGRARTILSGVGS